MRALATSLTAAAALTVSATAALREYEVTDGSDLIVSGGCSVFRDTSVHEHRDEYWSDPAEDSPCFLNLRVDPYYRLKDKIDGWKEEGACVRKVIG